MGVILTSAYTYLDFDSYLQAPHVTLDAMTM